VPLSAHVWKNRPVHPRHPEEIRIELVLQIGERARLVESDVTEAGIVDEDIDMPRACDHFLYRVFHRSLIGDVQFENMEG
jgi:hypothetical protein